MQYVLSLAFLKSLNLYKHKIESFYIRGVSTQFRAYPFERALFSALNRVLLIN